MIIEKKVTVHLHVDVLQRVKEGHLFLEEVFQKLKNGGEFDVIEDDHNEYLKNDIKLVAERYFNGVITISESNSSSVFISGEAINLNEE